MNSISNIAFLAQLEGVVRKYPNLTIKCIEGILFLKGIVDVPNDNGDIVGSFLIEIHSTPKFPYRFPKVFETGGMIPNEADWHKYADGSLCFTVEADEILKARTGVKLTMFIEQQVVPFLANHIYRKEKGCYKNEDYKHGIAGIAQFYATLLQTSDYKKWITYTDYVFRNKPYKKDRNRYCFCGRNQKFKKCHKIVFDILRDIGEEQVIKDLNNIIR